jgi:hypothetical protein
MRLILLRGLFIDFALIHLSSPIGELCFVPLIPSGHWIDLIVLGVESVGLLLLDVVLLLLLIEHLLLQLLILILLLCGLLSIANRFGV